MLSGVPAETTAFPALPGKFRDSEEMSETTGFGQNVRHQSFMLLELWL
jgi:hypothetical protein